MPGATTFNDRFSEDAAPIPSPDHKEKTAEGTSGSDRDFEENEEASPVGPVNSNIYDQPDGKNYRTMGRKDTVLVLTSTQLGLATVTLPSILKTLGIIPGLIAIIGSGLLSWYCGYQLLQFYKKHPHVVNIVEAAGVVGGKPFAIITGILMIVQLMFTCSNAIVTTSIALNTISHHALCTVSFMVIAAVFYFLISLPRTMKFVSYSGGPNAFGVISAALIVIIGLAIERPKGAPEDWTREIKVVAYPSFRDAANAVLKALWSFCTNVSFLSYMAEMKDPEKDFAYCLGWLEVSSISIYSVMAIVIYCLAGQYTVSPAISSAPLLLAKISYGLMMLGVIAAALTCGHVPIKLMYITAMRRMGALNQITDRSVRSWGTWIACVTVFWIIAFIVSNVIPVFDSIVQIAAATTVPWLTLGHSSIFWLWINRGKWTASWQKICLSLACVGLIVFSACVNGIGLWSSITELLDFFDDPNSNIRGVFSCGDNA